MTIYQQDPAGALSGPVALPLVPGAGLLIPAGFVHLDEPLADPAPGKAWRLSGSTLEQIEDQRGTAYDTRTGAAVEWRELGPLPEHLTKKARPSDSHHWQQDAWILAPLKVHTAKVQNINHACKAAITAGFWSPALGAPHRYSSELDDQLNLNGAVLRGLGMPYPCTDELGRKEYRLHTAEQLNQAHEDFTVFKFEHLVRANTLKQQLDLALAAGDLAALEAVRWEDPQS